MNISRAAPVGAREFVRLMARTGLFEPAPRVAVAVSGGADSMALALLVRRWAEALGGTVTALIVDHGLRAGSRAEAVITGRRLKVLGIDCSILTWRGDKPGTGVQAAARAARYGLLQDWCLRHGVLHLLLAHHLNDQAETVLLRMTGGSGMDGLAAMAPVVETPELRLMRPLLEVAPDRLRATLEKHGVEWVEDPSNRDMAHTRVRLRRLLPALAAQGLDAARLGATAFEVARTRVAMETETARLVARTVAVYPTGYCVLDRAGFAAAAPETAIRALSRVLTCIGGHAYAPRRQPVVRLHDIIAAPGRFAGRTLAGCRLAPAGGRIIVCREPRALGPDQALAPGTAVQWDGRFRVRLGGGKGRSGRLKVSALGVEGYSELIRRHPGLNHAPVPAMARQTLPAVFDGREIVSVPHLGFQRKSGAKTRIGKVNITFAPPNGLADTTFYVV